MKIVLKIGGNEIDDPGFLKSLSSLVANICIDGHQVVLVHGGGKEITNLLTRLGIETNFINGFRFTDPKSLEVIEMVLTGAINKRIVRSLQQNGVNTIGLSGVDGRILIAEKTTREGEDIGLVGEIKKVNSSLLEELIRNFVVVLSPVSATDDFSTSLNVNADYAAGSIAASIKSDLVVFLSNVPGVLKDGRVIPELSETEFANFKNSNVIGGGMVPKIEAALFSLRAGAKKAFITDAKGASQIVSGETAGTHVIA